jgi:glucose/arabinose dehydrogenase
MSRRSWVLAAVSIVLALTTVLGTDGGIPNAHPQRALASPLDAPLAAPDNSIVLQPILSGFTFPVFMTHAGDSTNRLWVVEKSGLIKLVVNGNIRPRPFLNLVDTVSEVGEQGLLGLAFHPQYESNGRFFVWYTANPSPGSVGNNTLEEYHVDEDDEEIANPVPVRTLLSIPDTATNHNAGTIAFGQDGKLYIATGDGGNTPQTAQDPTHLFGKVLRIDVDTPPTPQTTPDPPGNGYSLPTDNPFFGQGGGVREEIWALGFRNPYRWSFDRQTGDMLIGDVGAGTWEEVDFLPRNVGGLNFGWVIREGAHCTPPATSCQTAGLTDPILEYNHGLGCAITGGYRHRKISQSELYGVYFYADFCSGRIWKGIQSGGSWNAVEALDTSHQITSFAEDESGDLYVVASSGQILRIVPAPPPPCSQQARPRVVLQSTRTAPGTLQVSLTATTNQTTPANQIATIAFTRIDNGLVTIGNQVDRDTPFTFTPSAGSQSAGFTVKRKQAGVALTVRLTVTDACGPWQTFVGGGPSMP